MDDDYYDKIESGLLEEDWIGTKLVEIEAALNNNEWLKRGGASKRHL